MRELEARLNQALKAQLPKRVCRPIEKRRIEAAADRVEIAYHGQAAQDDDEVRRGAAKSGTTHFHIYATLAVVHSGQRFTLAMTFVWAGETMDVVLARLIKLARELGVRFKRLYCDKGFCSVAVLRLLRQRRVPYLIPIPARGGAGGIKSLFYGRCSYSTRYTFKRGTREAYTTADTARGAMGDTGSRTSPTPFTAWGRSRRINSLSCTGGASGSRRATGNCIR